MISDNKVFNREGCLAFLLVFMFKSMIKTVIILIAVVLLFSCNGSDVITYSDYSFNFYPRECNVIFADNACFQVFDEGTEWEYLTFDTIANGEVNAANYFLLLTTSNTPAFPEGISLENYNPITTPRYETWRNAENDLTDQPNPEIERQISESYNRVYKKESEWAGLPIEMDYRLTEVKKITISSSTQLFEKPTGSSLNQFFKLRHPAFIFTAPNRMVVGYESDVPEFLSIDKYLSYNPLIHPGLYFYLTNIPTEAPIKTHFIVQLEMADGNILTKTTEVVNLLP